ncbi:HAMP domain-containing sensor histidine kinase [Phytoactinopolyspora halotolerans]|uniref:histidine kinase n=1 Tax=Phytoactinopolyspora halotolerans TaxID=1981512 RepID=A0A6L9SFW5_9ACTN|nr:HAMP domain-containing sensor histidine kinase [Phytoactinopolyspora halotolerans]NEE03544.1 HAMP domain-containing histidine kinase [Phytoactinopolyspora halotolerans]
MTLRARLALLSSTAVALAVLGASVATWFLIRDTLLDDVDQRLLNSAPPGDRVLRLDPEETEGSGASSALRMLQGDPIGLQQVDADGNPVLSIPPGDVPIDLRPDELELLGGGATEPILRTETIGDTTYRIVSVAYAEQVDTPSENFFLRLVYPLDNVESTMQRMGWLLAGVAGVGIAAAGGLGWLIVRAGMRPVNALTEAAEQVARTKDLAHRIETGGHRRDEVTRLAQAVNTMLAALDDARTEQRHLVENAGHELRTPLTTLRNDIGMLVRSARHPDRRLSTMDREDLLSNLDSEVAALSELVTELVDLARREIEPEPMLETDLRALVDRAVARTRRVQPETTIEVRGESFEATVRPAVLERAIANLVRNAVQVSDGDGPVEVELCESREGWLSVRVLDRGPGISDDDLPHLFERFYRGEGARERHGSGLGLAIVAQAAEQHGGSVHAANRADGGAIFTLHIPPPCLNDHVK